MTAARMAKPAAPASAGERDMKLDDAARGGPTHSRAISKCSIGNVKAQHNQAKNRRRIIAARQNRAIGSHRRAEEAYALANSPAELSCESP